MRSKQNKKLYLNIQKLTNRLQERKWLIKPFKDKRYKIHTHTHTHTVQTSFGTPDSLDVIQ